MMIIFHIYFSCYTSQETTVFPTVVKFLKENFFFSQLTITKLNDCYVQFTGKGTQIWKSNRAIYDGDWKFDKRNGFGTFSMPDPLTGEYMKVYSGGWKNDKRHGYGTNFYSDTAYYEGEWCADKRSGWGRMYFENGAIYEGDWFDDKQSGEGMLRLGNENRYEGAWKNGKKHGPGKFYYLDKGQLYDGVWVEDIPKCGTMVDFDRPGAPSPTIYPIPEVRLADPRTVLQEARATFLMEED
ncbi:MORN repeat-containing protein 3 isoform X1 [Latimeria chalumnae]|uniref:MORN repeat-containing protein 3 isoform X1 n=1 Tax=Latimeria chalumnae TaxID=7897 RepID=UPI0003C157EC